MLECSIVSPILPTCLSMPGLCLNECTYCHTFLTFQQGHHSGFFSPTVVTKCPWEPASAGTLNTRVEENLLFSTEISGYFGNDTMQARGYCGSLVGSHSLIGSRSLCVSLWHILVIMLVSFDIKKKQIWYGKLVTHGGVAWFYLGGAKFLVPPTYTHGLTQSDHIQYGNTWGRVCFQVSHDPILKGQAQASDTYDKFLMLNKLDEGIIFTELCPCQKCVSEC